MIHAPLSLFTSIGRLEDPVNATPPPAPWSATEVDFGKYLDSLPERFVHRRNLKAKTPVDAIAVRSVTFWTGDDRDAVSPDDIPHHPQIIAWSDLATGVPRPAPLDGTSYNLSIEVDRCDAVEVAYDLGHFWPCGEFLHARIGRGRLDDTEVTLLHWLDFRGDRYVYVVNSPKPEDTSCATVWLLSLMAVQTRLALTTRGVPAPRMSTFEALAAIRRSTGAKIYRDCPVFSMWRGSRTLGGTAFDFTRPMQMLRASLECTSVERNYESQAVVGAMLLCYDQETVFALLAGQLLHCASDADSDVPNTILTLMMRVAVFGKRGFVAYAPPFSTCDAAQENDLCDTVVHSGTWARRTILVGPSLEVDEVVDDSQERPVEAVGVVTRGAEKRPVEAVGVVTRGAEKRPVEAVGIVTRGAEKRARCG